MIEYILKRLTEKTTWAGIIGAVVSAFSWQITPELAEAIQAAIVAIMAVVLILIKERD